MDDDGLEDDILPAPPAGQVDEQTDPGMKSAHARLSRKRTKTGCLTCRRRRIKCGEERPTCGNCIKSKRQCEGYNQRVIFKDPLSTYRAPTSSASTTFHARSIPAALSASQQSHFHPVQHTPQTSLPNFAGIQKSPSENQVLVDSTPSTGFSLLYSESGDQHAYQYHPTGDKEYGIVASEVSGSIVPGTIHYDATEPKHLLPHTGVLNHQGQNKLGPHYDFDSLSTQDSRSGKDQINPNLQYGWSNGQSCASESPLQELVYHSDIREAASALLTQSYQGSADWPTYPSPQNSLIPKFNPYLYSRDPLIIPDIEKHAGSENRLWEEAHKVKIRSEEVVAPQYYELHAESQHQAREERLPLDTTQYQNPVLTDTNTKGLVVNVYPDDQSIEKVYHPIEDTFDKSDDEMGLDESDSDAQIGFGKIQEDHLHNNDLGIVVALQASQDMQEQRLRTYHSFLDGPNILTSYQPSIRSSPLTDSTAARIFCHFINVTGPSISLYERHPANPSLMFQGRPILRSQQHIWAYTMPTLALNNQALLHAMLAIGSLHIALLQDSQQMPALKHYHIAIRRVAGSVKLPMRRGQPAILAATLLLGWYELMSGEHQKWSSHLLGATHLLKEIDFAGITKFIRNRKLQQRQARHGNLYHHEMALGKFESHPDEQTEFLENPKYDDVNEDIVGMIVGKKLRYDEYGQILEDVDAANNQYRVYTQQELETYETQRDLFWWYCKQDAFQSILSGNRLFMQYGWWSQCPPRAAIGKRDATYGTFDHLILLVGRLADFSSKDLKRKRMAIQANGGQWQPPPGASVQPNPTGPNAPHQSGSSRLPSFAGMMPGTEGKAQLPRGFSPRREESPASEDDNRSLENWTIEAEEEWQEIRTAFSILEEHFGLDFQPLGPEHCQPIKSPFGPALQYRTYSIAGIWIIYYMGLILCHRYHPSMPPAATVAAGLTARQTSFYANEIGRISAAIAPHASQVTQVSTGVGAGLIECTFGLFIAGVQYQNPEQRSWLVQRCLDIIRLTGWQTAEAIAMGCETAWTRAAELGRGPPYTRVTEKKIHQEEWYNAKQGNDPISPRDRGKVFVARTDRVHYALGLLSVERSLENLDFDE